MFLPVGVWKLLSHTRNTQTSYEYECGIRYCIQLGLIQLVPCISDYIYFSEQQFCSNVFIFIALNPALLIGDGRTNFCNFCIHLFACISAPMQKTYNHYEALTLHHKFHTLHGSVDAKLCKWSGVCNVHFRGKCWADLGIWRCTIP